MPGKRKRKKGPITWFLLTAGVFLVGWTLAFSLWLFWGDITKLFTRDGPRASARKTAKAPHENIPEEDRRQLEKVLKGR